VIRRRSENQGTLLEMRARQQQRQYTYQSRDLLFGILCYTIFFVDFFFLIFFLIFDSFRLSLLRGELER
jgi:hypothetical protein